MALSTAIVLGRGGSGNTDAGGAPIDGIPCGRDALSTHFHAHLELRSGAGSVSVPANIGINSTAGCAYWLHTHDDSGTIHVESSAPRTFTLGQFFDIWGQPLSATQAAGLNDGGAALHVFVDGQPYSGDPRAIRLTPHEQIVIESAPATTPPPTFQFPDGL